MWFMPAGDTGGSLGKGDLDPDQPSEVQRWQEKGASLGPFLVLEGTELDLAGVEGASC